MSFRISQEFFCDFCGKTREYTVRMTEVTDAAYVSFICLLCAELAVKIAKQGLKEGSDE